MADEQVPLSGPTSVSLDEMEQQTTVPPAVKPDDVKLGDGTDVPEEFRGKSMAEIMRMASGSLAALKVSERAREQAELMVRTATAAQPAAPPPPPAPVEKTWTKEELAELYEKDPMQAIEIKTAQTVRQAAEHFEKRLAPLYTGTAGAVEEQIKTKYKEEFATLGPEIENTIKEVGGRERLTSPKAWDDLIAYVRGQPANFDKLLAKRMESVQAQTELSAREAQVLETGFTPPPVRRTTVGSGVGRVDPIKEQIAGELGISIEEYLRWEKVS